MQITADDNHQGNRPCSRAGFCSLVCKALSLQWRHTPCCFVVWLWNKVPLRCSWVRWKQKVSFVYAHVSTSTHYTHTHTFEGLQSWVTKPTGCYFCAKPQHRTTFTASQCTPHNFDGTALQQQLPKFFSLHLFNPCVLLVIYFRLAYRLHCIPTYMHNTRITCARKS